MLYYSLAQNSILNWIMPFHVCRRSKRRKCKAEGGIKDKRWEVIKSIEHSRQNKGQCAPPFCEHGCHLNQLDLRSFVNTFLRDVSVIGFQHAYTDTALIFKMIFLFVWKFYQVFLFPLISGRRICPHPFTIVYSLSTLQMVASSFLFRCNYVLATSTSSEAPHLATLLSLRPNILLRALFSNTVYLCDKPSPHIVTNQECNKEDACSENQCQIRRSFEGIWNWRSVFNIHFFFFLSGNKLYSCIPSCHILNI